MNFTALKIPRKGCAHWSKSASPTGRIVEYPRRFFSCAVFTRAILSRALTLQRTRHTLNFQFAGKGSGEGRVNRPRSRHCNRLRSRKPGHPPVPQRAALFARKSHAIRPKLSRGAFLLLTAILWSGEICERSRTSAPRKRLLGRRRSLAFLRGVVACSEHFSDLFGIPSLSGSYRRNRPHGSCPPAGQPYRVARAEFDGNRLRAWVAGSSRRRYRILRLPCGCAEKDQSGGRDQSQLGADRELASGHRSRDQSFQSSRNCTIARKPGNFFLRNRSSYRRGNHLVFKKTLRCAWCSRGRRNTRRRIEAPACQSATTNWRSAPEACPVRGVDPAAYFCRQAHLHR